MGGFIRKIKNRWKILILESEYCLIEAVLNKVKQYYFNMPSTDKQGEGEASRLDPIIRKTIMTKRCGGCQIDTCHPRCMAYTVTL